MTLHKTETNIGSLYTHAGKVTEWQKGCGVINIKDKWLYAGISVLLAATAVVSVMLFSTLLNYDRNTHHEGELYPIAITGEYSEEGGPWTP